MSSIVTIERMQKKLRYWIFFLCVLNPVLLIAANQEINLHAETWDVPRYGEALLRIPELQDIVKQWMVQPQKTIHLRYPGGEAGELWVGELKDWLVSLGVASKSIQISAGSDAEDVINMKLVAL